MKRALLGFGVLVVAVLVAAAIRAALMQSTQPAVEAISLRPLETEAIVERYAAALRFPTVSARKEGDYDQPAFAEFRAFLRESFPAVHGVMQRELVNEHSLLYTWPGKDPSLAPLVVQGHYDVVPADEADGWTHPPFGGVVADGDVWGRGALDNKNNVMLAFEAARVLVSEGFQPVRTVYFAFGHDEEVGGRAGAERVANLLGERGVRPALVLDEGGALMRGMIPGLGDRPVALIGIAEKGSVNVGLVAEHHGGGHSSMPPPKTAVGRLATAIHRLEANQRPASLGETLDQTLAALAPELPFAARFALALRPLSNPLLRWGFAQRPETAALIRTTTAATMMSGSSKENILPRRARAAINFRILPGESSDTTVEHVRHTIADESIAIEPYVRLEPTNVSRTDTPGYALLGRTVLETVPDAIVTPWLVTARTDARYYHPLSDSVYRFAAMHSGADAIAGIHGVNERISIGNIELGVRFYARLFENLGAL